MVSGQVILVALAIALAIYAADGIKHVGHNLKCKFHHTDSCDPK